MTRVFWREFFKRFISSQTARFILAILALAMAQYAMVRLMGAEIKAANRDALLLAIGVVLGLSKDAFSYYFGSTARGDERPQETHITNTAPDPLPVDQRTAG